MAWRAERVIRSPPGSIWCFPAAHRLSFISFDRPLGLFRLFTFFLFLPRPSSPSTLLSYSRCLLLTLPSPFSSPSLRSFSLARFSRNNLISVVVRSFYFGVFSDPFRLVWQLMQPIFRLVSFYPGLINQYANSFHSALFREFSSGEDRRPASWCTDARASMEFACCELTPYLCLAL